MNANKAAEHESVLSKTRMLLYIVICFKKIICKLEYIEGLTWWVCNGDFIE